MPHFFKRRIHKQNFLLTVLVSLCSIALSVPPLRMLIEQSMLWHMAVQMPLLIFAGWLLMASGAPLPAAGISTPTNQLTALQTTSQTHSPCTEWNVYGLTGFVFSFITITYWMLPSAIDRAVILPSADVIKLMSLLVCGASLRHSSARAPALIQLFFLGNFLAMMLWLGSYFLQTDLRLCNAYSLQSQINTGWGLIAWGLGIGVFWGAKQLIAMRPKS